MTSLGIFSIGLMFGVPNLDTILVDFTSISGNAVTVTQLGFFALGLYFFIEGGAK